MTSGDPAGTKRAERLATMLCLGGAVLFILTLNTINVFTALADRPGMNPREPLISEATSAISSMALIWLPWLTLSRLPLDRPPLWRTLGIHTAVLLAFSLLHVGGFVLLRRLTYSLMGGAYDFGDWWPRFGYEFRKDAFYYCVVLLCFWLLRDRIIARAARPEPAPPATFDIRDGARLVRAGVSDILAVSSAGNYAEFHLADGRKPLMRASLASLEAQLGPLGFVRTHRSWLVNAARVTELRPEGSGDYAVTLGGVVAPLSRRFPDALARLRGG